MMIAAALGAPIAAAAQVVTVPPTPPAPKVPPTPVVRPAPVVVPAETLANIAMIDARAIADGVQGALNAISTLDVAQVREAARSAEIAAAQAARFDLLHPTVFEPAHFDFSHNFEFGELQQSLFTTSSSEGNYNSGRDLVGRGQYDAAIARLDRVIAAKGRNVDGALYWKAYAQFRLGKKDDAIATIATLRKDHPQSRYLNDAKALEADVRKADPSTLDDDELKLLAINAMQHQDPERAIPLLEGVLNSANTLRVKKQALYVMALSNHARAQQILLNYAKGASNPDLQLEAIRYFTANRNNKPTAQNLLDIYQGTDDLAVKQAIIGALRTSGNTAALGTIVNSTNTPLVIRTSALNSLTGILSPQDLWTLYEKEQSKELKMQMISAFGSMDAVDYLNRIIKTEKDPEVRRRAIRSLGGRKADKTGQMLVDMYAGEVDVENRRTIISALSNQNNAEGLVAIARKETTLTLKRDIVARLSEMAPKNKVAADYLMEIIR
jgi:tetratricopeptide (TPR) repeat protein